MSVWIWEELVNGKWVPWEDTCNGNTLLVHPSDTYVRQPEPHTPQYGRFRWQEYAAASPAREGTECEHHRNECENCGRSMVGENAVCLTCWNRVAREDTAGKLREFAELIVRKTHSCYESKCRTSTHCFENQSLEVETWCERLAALSAEPAVDPKVDAAPPEHTAFIARRWVEQNRNVNESSQIASLIELLRAESGNGAAKGDPGLEQLRELSQKATPGEWHSDPGGYSIYIWGPNDEMIAMMRGTGAGLPQRANQEYIVAAANYVRQVLAANGNRSQALTGTQTGAAVICGICSPNSKAFCWWAAGHEGECSWAGGEGTSK